MNEFGFDSIEFYNINENCYVNVRSSSLNIEAKPLIGPFIC